MTHNTRRNIGIIVLIIVILGFAIAFFGTQQTFISTRGIGLENQIETVSWNGMNTILTAPWFGSITSGQSNPLGGDFSICGDNDGDITISNAFNNNEDLLLKSSMFGKVGKFKSTCINSITAEIDALPGVYTINCETSATQSESSPSESSCIIDGKEVAKSTESSNVKNSPNSDIQIIRIDEPRKLIVVAKSFGMDGGRASSTATISFSELQVEEIEIEDIPAEDQEGVIGGIVEEAEEIIKEEIIKKSQRRAFIIGFILVLIIVIAIVVGFRSKK